MIKIAFHVQIDSDRLIIENIFIKRLSRTFDLTSPSVGP